MDFKKLSKMISELDLNAMEQARVNWDMLAKPQGSLGGLEKMHIKVAGMCGDPDPVIDKRAVIVMCADNGLVEEGLTLTGKEVTTCIENGFSKGLMGINVFSALCNADPYFVDIGVDNDLIFPGIINRKIARGTGNIARGPAMSRDEAVRAVNVGIDMVNELKSSGYNLLLTGEAGIGNTTTSSAVSAVLTSLPAEVMVGIGAGLSAGSSLQSKADLINKAIKVNNPDPGDPLDVLAKLGGFDIGGLCGCFIGAAINRMPIFVDGFISSAAALVACRLEPKVRNYLLPSHFSAEPGARKVAEELGIDPFLNLGLRLGEGTGAAIGLTVLDYAFRAYSKMGTLQSIVE